MAELLKGAPVARALTEELAARCAALRERGVVPTLAIVRVGEREDDLSYERGALKRCEKVGIEVRRVLLPADVSQDELMAAIEGINADPAVHGCLMFRPLPAGLDEDAVKSPRLHRPGQQRADRVEPRRGESNLFNQAAGGSLDAPGWTGASPQCPRFPSAPPPQITGSR